MDRKWMSANRLSKEYADGVEYFVNFAVRRLGTSSKFKCPCLRCCYANRVTAVELGRHLKANGIDQSYICWTMHGEKRGEPSNMDNSTQRCDPVDYPETFDGDQFEEMAKAVEDDLNDSPQMFEKLITDAETPLYAGCTEFTKLSAVIKLLVMAREHCLWFKDACHEIMIPMGQTQRFIFLCPANTFLRNVCIEKGMSKDVVKEVKQAVKANNESVKAYVNRRLALAHESSCDSLFLAPINLGIHWVLLVVDPKRNTIFYLDSCHGHYSNHVKLKGMFESCLMTYWGSTEVRARVGHVKTKWIGITCPRQPNNDDCGYYVMKFMKDIITHNQIEIPEFYFPEHEVGAPFSGDQLDEVKGEWCHHVARLINENRNSCN